jgi:glycogen debranching enzyme
MTQPSILGEESEPVPAATVTLVHGTSFVICDAGGDVTGSGIEGLFVADTRICSRLELRIDGARVEPLTVARLGPSAACFVGRTHDRALIVFRDLWVGAGMRLDLRVRSCSDAVLPVQLDLELDTDLADLFAVKEGRAEPVLVPAVAEGSTVCFRERDKGRGLVVRARDGAADARRLTWRVEIPAGAQWSSCVELAAERGPELVTPVFRCGEPSGRIGAPASASAWRSRPPQIDTDVPGLADAAAQTAEDLIGLRLVDPDHPDEPLIAAGAPWYMTLFGRDSLLTSWMALPVDPNLGLATARALARLQGRKDDPTTGEQPGRILHEVRFSVGSSLALAEGDVHYGTADATPLFVMLVHELWRWGVARDDVQLLLPAVDAALDWMQGPGDPDGDGYIEYAPPPGNRLQNQGWKDSYDGISFADGRLPEPPIALAEVQAYAYAAYRAGAALAAAVGDHRRASARTASAETLLDQFDRDFWLPDRRAIALALDGEKQAVDAVASNMGHCLWTGIVEDRDKAMGIARWLVSPEMFTGWGVRTLATSMARYNPLSYHNGSAWPHDTAICVAGLRRSGFVDEALTITEGLLAASDASTGRLPELFAGLTRTEVAVPVPYPASCSPQAWASAAPLLLLRAMLGLEPDVPGRRLELDPVLPKGASRLRLTDMPLGATRITIELDRDAVAVRGLPRGLSLIRPAL